MTPDEVAALSARLQRVEDQLAIYQVISAYGPAVDSCDMDALARACAADACYEIADVGSARGWDAVRALFDAPMHRTLVQGGCAHVASLPHVRIDGDRAIATHYTQVLAHQDDGGFRCVRLSAHRWELERGPGGWVMKHRRTALLDGNALAQELLRAHARGPGGADVPAP